MTQWQIPKETKELIFQIFADFGNEFGVNEHHKDTLEYSHNNEEYTLNICGNTLALFSYTDTADYYTIMESTIQEQDTIDDIMQICEFMQMRYLKYLERGKK